MKRIILFTLLTVTIVKSSEKTSDYYRELSDNIRLFFDVMMTINENYVDTADIEKMMNEGIRAMLSTTDPYTVLLRDRELDHFNELSTGTYGGLGIFLGTSGPEKTLTVISPMDDTPASRAGLRAGDQIIFIDGKSTSGMTVRDASTHLRGEKGSRVNLKINRIGSERPLDFNLVRENINVRNIPYSELMDDGVGYIKLTQFTATSYSDFVRHFEKLISEGASSMIVDLRFNPGGLLDSAVRLTSGFLPRGSLVVFTRGRGETIDNEYTTYMTPLDTEIPLVVLINGSSASASEIFAGALQDHDRAVIIGEQTFGKGLVQQLFDVGNHDRRNLKMTVRRYYTPSGRQIQKDIIEDDKNLKAEKDTVFFNTLINKRKVASEMGVIPDIEIKSRRTPEYIQYLRMNNHFTDFLYHFTELNQDREYDGEVDDRILNEFREYLDNIGSGYRTRGEYLSDSLLKYFDDNGYDDEIVQHVRSAAGLMKQRVHELFDKHTEDIRTELQKDFSVFKWGSEERYRISNRTDNVIIRAAEILRDNKRYRKILGY